MATFPFSTMAPPQGATLVFGSWVCVGHLTNPTKLKATTSESSNKLAGSDDHGVMLLLDLAKEIEKKLKDNSGSTWTQVDLKNRILLGLRFLSLNLSLGCVMHHLLTYR